MRSLSERVVDAALERLEYGDLVVRTPDGDVRSFQGDAPGPSAEVVVSDPRAFRRVAVAGSMGLAEAFMSGQWDSPDLDSVLDLGIRNLRESGASRIFADPLGPVQRLYHRLRPNSLRGAEKNIRHHYDLGNDFYELWLDDTMTYSSACFDDDCRDLEHAQVRKWDRILELLDPRPDDHLLEIGCGWGGFAMHAAREAGCRVTGISLSREQTAMARERIEASGLSDRVDVRIQDYRHVGGPYDGIASIEMFEAVGERYWPAFFDTLGRALRPGRRAVLQVITIAEERFGAYRRRADFIQKYIFPGGMLPSPGAFSRAAQAAGLAVGGMRFFGESYARTIEAWQERFEGMLDDVRSMGFDERFIRMWRYYLAYCRAGFRAGTIDVMQAPLEPAG